MNLMPYTFQDAVIQVMKVEKLTIRPAIARAHNLYPNLYQADRAISVDFTEGNWFNLIDEAKALSARCQILFKQALIKVYEANPALIKSLLSRNYL